MKLSATTRMQKFGVSFGALLVTISLWLLAQGISQAVAFGTVTLEYGKAPWPHAWAYFASLVLGLVAGASFLAAAFGKVGYLLLGLPSLLAIFK